MMDSGLSILADGFGQQSGIYKAAFAASKAYAIAQSMVAINAGIARAASLPFPSNLMAMATVAMETANIVSNIKRLLILASPPAVTPAPVVSISPRVLFTRRVRLRPCINEPDRRVSA